MNLTMEEQQRVLQNQALVTYLVNKLGVNKNFSEYEDIISIGNIGLIKAAKSYDSSRNVAFSTYSSKIIYNEIYGYFNKTKMYRDYISIDVCDSDEENRKNLLEEGKIEDPKSNFIDTLIARDECLKVVSIILNFLKDKERMVMLYSIEGMNQEKIARKLNFSQSGVSKTKKKAIAKIKMVLNRNTIYKEIFAMDILDDYYIITFSTQDVKHFNEIFAKILNNQEICRDIPDFKVSSKDNRITIKVPAYPESFSIIAQIIQKMDNWEMNYISPKPDAKEQTIPQYLDTPAFTLVEKDKSDKKDEAPKLRGKQIQQIREYILQIGKFDMKSLRKKFRNASKETIKDAIYPLKKRGIIIRYGKGEYRLNPMLR